MYKVVFVGSNPSQRSASIVPFWHDTRSTKILCGWLSRIQSEDETLFFESLHYLNVSNAPTPGNRPLKMSEIHSSLISLEGRISSVCADRVVALGKTAEKALTLLHISHYAMPHPSGLNRNLNNPEYVTEKLNGLRCYLRPPIGSND